MRGGYAERFTDGGEIGHGRARNTALDLGQKADRAVDALGQFAQGQVLEFAQVVNKDREGFNLFVHLHRLRLP